MRRSSCRRQTSRSIASARLIQSAFEWSSLDTVVETVSEATEHEDRVYVERLGGLHRWSLVHSGGPYPLLRITPRYLHTDYKRLIVGCRALNNGLSVLFDDDADQSPADRWALFNLPTRTPPYEVSARVRSALKARNDRQADEV